jgi:hypothetical protein
MTFAFRLYWIIVLFTLKERGASQSFFLFQLIRIDPAAFGGVFRKKAHGLAVGGRIRPKDIRR